MMAHPIRLRFMQAAVQGAPFEGNRESWNGTVRTQQGGWGLFLHGLQNTALQE